MCANLAAYCNNQSFNCTTPTVINLTGTPLVVHPLQRHRKKRNCSHVLTTKPYSSVVSAKEIQQ